jgi:hypothetical protein
MAIAKKSHVITSYTSEGGLLPLSYTNNFASGNFFLLEQTVSPRILELTEPFLNTSNHPEIPRVFNEE